MNWYLKVFRQYADFQGRARRKEFWIFTLVNALVLCVLSGLAMPSLVSGEGGSVFWWLIYSAYALAVFVPSLAVGVRRLHDAGKSGWWYLIALVPLIGGIWLLVLWCLDSQPFENRWGGNPKEAEEL